MPSDRLQLDRNGGQNTFSGNQFVSYTEQLDGTTTYGSGKVKSWVLQFLHLPFVKQVIFKE
jgi:hypothetical protein